MISDWNAIDPLARKVWDFGCMGIKPQPSDAIVVFGSYNPLVAERAAELYLQRYSPLIVFTGGRSDSTLAWQKSEAETFADAAIAAGVPENAILLETRSRNTGENVRLTRELLEGHGLSPKRIIAIQKPYAERRVYATVRKQWPEVEVIPASPSLSYEEYMAGSPLGKEGSISVMLGDLARLKTYPMKGFQIPQDIPEDVWHAYEELAAMGLAQSPPE